MVFHIGTVAVVIAIRYGAIIGIKGPATNSSFMPAHPVRSRSMPRTATGRLAKVRNFNARPKWVEKT